MIINKKKVWRARVGATCLVCMLTTLIGVAGACSNLDNSTSSSIDSPISISPLPDHYETYAVGETISIRSSVYNVNGESLMLYGTLLKGGETCASVTPETWEKNYVFTETGEYVLMWYYEKDGEITVVKNEELTVGYQPYFNISFASEYLTGDSVSLMAECIYEGYTFDTSVEVLSPYNELLSLSDMDLTFTESGKYKVSYSAKVGNETFTRDYWLTAVGRMQNYKDYIRPISGVQNVIPEFVAPDYIADYIDPNDPEGEAKATGGKGVLVEMDGTAAFRYRNIVDLNTFDETIDLVKFAVLGSDGYVDLNNLQINLIDAYDSSNTIAFHLQCVNNSQTQWVYANVLYKNVKYSRTDSGTMRIDSRYGRGTNILFKTDLLKTALQYDSFTGKGKGNNPLNADVGKATWGHFQINYANKEFYVYEGQYNSKVSKQKQALIVDLDDTNQVGAYNEWQGFTTGEVYIEISVVGQGSRTGVILQEIAGEKLYENNDNDMGASAWFEEEKNGMLPSGETGTFYPFATVAYTLDTIDGKILMPEYKVVGLKREIFEGLKYTDVAFNQNGFTPTQKGRYFVTYQLQDQDGNVSKQTECFDVVDDLGEMSVQFSQELPTSFMVGQYFTVPKLIKKGFSHLSNTQESIIYNGVEYASRTYEKILLDKAGTIVFKCSYKDFLGREYVYEKEYSVTLSEKPVTNMLGVLPSYVVKGSKIVLPAMSAINYGKEATAGKSNAEWKLIVDGQEINTKERMVEVAKNHGETMLVEYKIGEETKYSYEIKVVEAKYLHDRFYPVSGDVKATAEKYCINLTATEDSVVDYINALILDDSTYTIPLTFTFTEMQTTTFESVDVYYEDYKNPEACIFIRLINENGEIKAQINGEGQKYSIELENGRYRFAYRLEEKKFTFATKETVDTTADGKDFGGFASKLLKVRFVFNGITAQTQLNVYEISSLTFISAYEKDNETLKEYVDKSKPLLVSEKTYRDNSMEFGSEMFIPAIEARTPLTGLMPARITVTSPSGKTIVNNQNAYNDQSFTLNEFGDYKIIYKVEVPRGTETTIYNFRVYPKDRPQITLSKDLQGTYKVGAKIVVPLINVSGATDYEVSCYIVKPDYSREKVEIGKEITLTQYGTYRFEVVIIDEFNTTYERWSFKVEV